MGWPPYFIWHYYVQNPHILAFKILTDSEELLLKLKPRPEKDFFTQVTNMRRRLEPGILYIFRRLYQDWKIWILSFRSSNVFSPSRDQCKIFRQTILLVYLLFYNPPWQWFLGWSFTRLVYAWLNEEIIFRIICIEIWTYNPYLHCKR